MGSAEDHNAARAALTFDASIHTPAKACQMLAPGTLHQLQSTFGPCDQSLPRQDLPVGSRVISVDVYGKEAMVSLDQDVLFLARYSDGWKVTAAGCTPQPGRPYDCTLDGN
jgi:hypothetical protein